MSCSRISSGSSLRVWQESITVARNARWTNISLSSRNIMNSAFLTAPGTGQSSRINGMQTMGHKKGGFAFKFDFGSAKDVPMNRLAAKEEESLSRWSRYSLPSMSVLKDSISVRSVIPPNTDQQTHKPASDVISAITKASIKATDSEALPSKRRRKLRPRKALISLSPAAIKHLRALLDQPEPKLIRVSARNRGCSGLTYDLQYISEPGKFDEVVEQDGVKIVIDSKALFSVVGSEMDWVEDKLAAKFVFKNPNSKGTCGCGESFMV